MKVDVAVLAKAPIAGFAKTRLIPAIGAHAAAVLQERLTAQAVATARAARIGTVTLWCAPDPRHGAFRELAVHHGITLKRQAEGDLGARMLAAMSDGPTLTIGTDCPALTVAHLHQAAEALRESEVVLIPAEDGGYVLIGTRSPCPALFDGMAWGTDTVLAETRRRSSAIGLSLTELGALWDIDTESGLARLERELPELALG
jgi:rSAM/selenodomain-associated transferase 1